jgi:hypothetical protein
VETRNAKEMPGKWGIDLVKLDFNIVPTIPKCCNKKKNIYVYIIYKLT